MLVHQRVYLVVLSQGDLLGLKFTDVGYWSLETDPPPPWSFSQRLRTTGHDDFVIPRLNHSPSEQ